MTLVKNHFKPVGQLVLVASVVALGACTSSPSNVEPPSSLKSFNEKYQARVLWSASIGSTQEYGGRMAPSITDSAVVAANGQGLVASFDKTSGKKNWEVSLGKKVNSGVAIGAGLAAVATRNGSVIALSLKDGSVLWKANVGGEILGNPAVTINKLIVQTVDGKVSALSVNTGRTLWKYEKAVPPLSLRGSSGPVYQQGLVVAGFAGGQIVGLDVRSGRELWERVVSYPSGRSEVERLVDVDSPPVIHGVTLFAVSYQGKLVAIDLRSGNTLWTRPMSSYLPMAVDSRNVYVVNASGVVMAIDQVSGADVWAQNDLKRRITTGPARVKDAIVVGDFEGYLHILDLETGKISGRHNIDNSRVLSHLVSENGVYTNTQAGKVLAYSVESE